MSEMLANHYFMIRNFEKAVKSYESVVFAKSNSKSIRKKMIICYVKTFQVEKAFDEFYKLVEEDIAFITKTNLITDDCPCPDIIAEIERNEIDFKDKYEKLIALGILYLYCDKKESLVHFAKAYQINQRNIHLYKLIQLLT
jgi:tetratricopeptide (TPR) repeat protein